MDTRASIADVRLFPYFQDLPEQSARELAARLRVQSHAAGSLILVAGRETPGFLVLRRGRARIFRTRASGREQTLRLLGAGETFGEVPVLDGGPLPSSVQAIDDCEAVLVPADVFRELVLKDAEIALRVLKLFAQRLREFTEMVGQMTQSVESRVARHLLDSADQQGSREATSAVIDRFSLEAIASLLGCAPEVVSRTLHRLQEQGLVEVSRRTIAIRDRPGLAALI